MGGRLQESNPVARETLNDANVYDPEVVYAGKSTDKHGHSTNIRAHIPNPWVAAIAEFIASSDWPEYTTIQHFYRDAIYHRMRWAAKQTNRLDSPRVRALIAIAEGEAGIENAELLREASKMYVERARKVLTALAGDNNETAVRETLKSMESGLDHIQEPWKTDLQREINNAERRLTGL